MVSESVIPPPTRLLTKPTFPDVSCRWWWAFEGVVLGFCVNPLLRTSLAGCLLLLIRRNLPGSWGGGGEGVGGVLRISQIQKFEWKREVYLQSNCSWFIEMISEQRTRISNKIIRALEGECSSLPPVPDISNLCFDGQ